MRTKLGMVLAMAVLTASLAVAGSVGPASAATCNLVPVVRDVTINQGLGSYTRLAQGKEALVRVYLSLPSCAPNGSSITLRPTGTSMTVTNGSATIGNALAPVSPSTTPTLVPYASAPAVDAAGDPKFVLPGSSLVSADGAGFNAGFTFSIAYSSKASRTAPEVTGTLPVSTRPGSTTPISVAVEKRVAPLRVLVVGMGDASRDYSTQLTAAGINAVQQGMATLSRMMPVSDGVGALASTTGAGVRYTITPSLIDLGPNGLKLLDAEGKFCGTAANFEPIKGTLAAFLTEWNTANPTAPADRVVGIADEVVSRGAEANCADGWATVKGSVGWVRALADRTGAPSMTGSLLAMELAHTLGLVPPTRDAFGSLYHSPNLESDATAPDRAYHLTSRAYVQADRTAMRVSSGWNNATTVFEQADWAFAQCALGGTVTSECTTYASNDATAGSAPEPVFVLSGTIGHNASGHVANVVDSHVASGRPTGPTSDTHVQLVQRGSSGAVRTDNVHVAPEESTHDQGGGVAEPASGTFRVAVPLDPRTSSIELRSGTQVLYTRQASAPPVMTSGSSSFTVVGVKSVSADAAVDDTAAALSPDGEVVAWQRPAGLVIASATDPTKRVAVAGGTQPAIGPRFSPDSKRYPVAYVVADGSINFVNVDLTSGTPVLTAAPQLVYDATPFLGSSNPASHPTFAPDNSRIAFAVAGDIATIELVRSSFPCDLLGVLLCRATKVAATPAVESWPTWSQSEPSTIAYVQGADVVRRDIGSGNTASSTADVELLAAKATEPSWGGNAVAYRSTDATKPGLFVLDTSAPGATATRVTTSGTDLRPALVGGAGGPLMWDRPEGVRRDIVTGRPRSVSTWTATDASPADLRLTVLLGCTGDRRPLAVGLRPTSVSGTTATFTYEWDSALGCRGGDVMGAVSDGYFQTAPRSAGVVGGGTAPSPAIVVPAPGTVVRAGDVVATKGAAVDAEDRSLPGSQLSWELVGPGGATTWTGEQRDLVGLAPGAYTLRLRAVDSAGRAATTQGSFTVLDAWVDVVRGTADFDPDTLNIPSNGNEVVMRVQLARLAEIDPATVRLTSIAGLDVSNDSRFTQKAWSISGDVASVKFDRQALERFLYDEHGIIGRSVEITVGGRSAAAVDPPWRFFASGHTFVTRS